MTSQTIAGLTVYYNEVKEELDAILQYWNTYAPDVLQGGFIGKVDEQNIPDLNSPKGSVLNARILWSFSAAWRSTQNPVYLANATKAFEYFTDHFIDFEFGGVYWTVDATGKPLDTKKQVYALSFAIYAFSAYYEVTNNALAKELAIDLYHQIEQHSFDAGYTGYFEAFTRDWQLLDDLRLSAKDANEKKTMNTHLHVLEAYTALYRIWPDENLEKQLHQLILNFTDHIIDDRSGHLVLFFDEQWKRRSGIISYGHDIEAAWLLNEAAKVVGDKALTVSVNKLSHKIAAAAATGLDVDGGLWYETDPAAHHTVKEKHWWVQAEAMVGFLDQWQLTGDVQQLQRSLAAWEYVRESIKDPVYGEWFWGRLKNGALMPAQDKVGIWKCPYHNTRACLEVMDRIQHYLKQTTDA